MFLIIRKLLFICTIVFGCNNGLPLPDTGEYRHSMAETDTKKKEENLLEYPVGSRHIRRSNGDYITRDEYDDDKSVIMARIEQITQNLMQFDSRIDENKDGINELRDNTVKRCESDMVRMHCQPWCCSIDGGECKTMDGAFTFTVPISFSKAFQKPPTVSATSPVIEFYWPESINGDTRDTFDFSTSDVTSSGFNVKYSFNFLHIVFQRDYALTWTACA